MTSSGMKASSRSARRLGQRARTCIFPRKTTGTQAHAKNMAPGALFLCRHAPPSPRPHPPPPSHLPRPLPPTLPRAGRGRRGLTLLKKHRYRSLPVHCFFVNVLWKSATKFFVETNGEFPDYSYYAVFLVREANSEGHMCLTTCICRRFTGCVCLHLFLHLQTTSGTGTEAPTKEVVLTGGSWEGRGGSGVREKEGGGRRGLGRG